ncbi:Glycogen phosphorylase [Rhodovulum sp. PH10]|uniref:alpha-glucan family phosphorylase n=1 Tax=Rhodovulum sp. PH10 TaxID=1187851 RepID=UPI00027C2756|nr:alpha-glucan family phosphorylase [Rhodovulum sp. PH10]EJW13016.1 Glycogen phosphorylase [Rhodovulum sp. PH10]
MIEVAPYLSVNRIAYFSMEVGIREEMHTYSGGLGLLAGDAARSAADLDLPMVFVTLASREGSNKQEIDADGNQIDAPDPWNPEEWAIPIGALVAVKIEGRQVWIRPWLYELASPRGPKIPVILLDTNVSENDPRDRIITNRLYFGDQKDRIKQEAVLGIGGVRVLRALGFSIDTYHLNEGHAAFLSLALLDQHRINRIPGIPEPFSYDVHAVREKCVFTTHTPVEAGHDRFDYADVRSIVGDLIEFDQLKLLAGADKLNMTRLALNLSRYANGVARRHAETAQKMFPEYKISTVTNGAHVPTWMHPAIAELFRTIAPHWAYQLDELLKADQMPPDALWAAHQKAKGELLAHIRATTGVEMDPEVPLIGFARRMTGYKRPDLLFHDVERLKAIGQRYPFQVVMAGKSHPRDFEGKGMIRGIHAHMRAIDSIPMTFLPNYSIAVANKLVSGVDVWLNNPVPPLEASGTSGMKAAFNGVLNFSVLDGWWLEGWEEGVTGWSIGTDGSDSSATAHANDMYGKLESTVLPLYCENRARWIWMMQQTIAKIGAVFNSTRMMRRYATEAYLRS